MIQSTSSIALTTGTYLIILGFDKFSLYKDIVPFLELVAYGSLLLGLLFIVALNWILKRYDKLPVYAVLTWTVAVVAVLAFFSSLTSSGFYPFVFFLLILVVLSSPIGIIDTLFLRDLVIYDTFLSGLHRENMYQVG